jgi:hypothetical protein
MTPALAPFTAHQTATLRAALDRIIPPDDFPGAWEAGVGEYLRRQFSGALAPLVGEYEAGLDVLDSAARTASGRDFAALTEGEQDALLAAIETGAHGPALAAFFATLVTHAIEGYYSDPGNGGNRDGVAWTMIGFEVRG